MRRGFPRGSGTKGGSPRRRVSVSNGSTTRREGEINYRLCDLVFLRKGSRGGSVESQKGVSQTTTQLEKAAFDRSNLTCGVRVRVVFPFGIGWRVVFRNIAANMSL